MMGIKDSTYSKLRIRKAIIAFRLMLGILLKAILLIFKKDKNLKIVDFNYYKNWRFKNSYIIIYHKFNNALYYKIGHSKYIITAAPIIIDLQHRQERHIKIQIYGLFQKKELYVDIEKEAKLNSDSFKTNILNLNTEVRAPKKTISINTHLKLNTAITKITIAKVALTNRNITINPEPFKKTTTYD